MICELAIIAAFNFYKAEAAKTFGYFPPTTVEVAERPEQELGRAWWGWKLKRIEISPTACDYGELVMHYVVLHEIGHIAANMFHPNLPSGKEHEAKADHYGSRLWSHNEELVNRFKELCEQGQPWACRNQKTWAQASN